MIYSPEAVLDFDAWFDESKIVDAGGAPLIAYHGTGTPGFSHFNNAFLGRNSGCADAREGFFFAENPKAADEFTWCEGKKCGAIYPVYLSIANPMVVDDFILDGTSGTVAASYIQTAKSAGHDGVIFAHSDMLGHLGRSFVAFDASQIRFSLHQFNPKEYGMPSALSQTERRQHIATLRQGGAKIEGDKITLYRGGNVTAELLQNLRYGDFLSAVKDGEDATGNLGASAYGPTVVKVVLPVADVILVSTCEYQFKGESHSLDGGQKYPLEIYRAYNDVYASNYTTTEIDSQHNVREVASQGLAGGRNEFDALLAQHMSSANSASAIISKMSEQERFLKERRNALREADEVVVAESQSDAGMLDVLAPIGYEELDVLCVHDLAAAKWASRQVVSTLREDKFSLAVIPITKKIDESKWQLQPFLAAKM